MNISSAPAARVVGSGAVRGGACPRVLPRRPRCCIYRAGHQPGGTWGRARRLAAVTGAGAVVAVGGLGWVGGVGHCGRLGTLCNGSRPRGAAGAAAGGAAKRSIRAWIRRWGWWGAGSSGLWPTGSGQYYNRASLVLSPCCRLTTLLSLTRLLTHTYCGSAPAAARRARGRPRRATPRARAGAPAAEGRQGWLGRQG